MRKKKENLSERVRLPEKYRMDRMDWLRDLPEKIKIQRRAGNDERKRTLEELQAPPAPGMGQDGYPLMK